MASPADDVSRREWCAKIIGVGGLINSFSWTVVTTAQLGMGLRLAPSQDHLVQMTALARSTAQLTAFFVLPALGNLSDTVGRKPLLVARSCVVFVFSGLVAVAPSYKLFLLHRLVSNLTHHLVDATVQASMADLYQGKALASAISTLRSHMAIAMLAGPASGGWLAERSFRLCFALSAMCGLVNALLYALVLPETMERNEASESQPHRSYSSVNPISFLKLFGRGRALATLTVATALSEMCDGTTEIDRYYAQDVAGLSFTQNGMYQSARGLAMVLGGRLVSPILRALGTSKYTTLCNLMAAVHMLGKSLARTPTTFFAALVPNTLGAGSYREAALKAQLMRLALASGMTRGEVSACEANFRALLSTSAPFLYSFLYTGRVSTVHRGLPYLAALALLSASHLVFCSLRAADLGEVAARCQQEEKS